MGVSLGNIEFKPTKLADTFFSSVEDVNKDTITEFFKQFGSIFVTNLVYGGKYVVESIHDIDVVDQRKAKKQEIAAAA